VTRRLRAEIVEPEETGGPMQRLGKDVLEQRIHMQEKNWTRCPLCGPCRRPTGQLGQSRIVTLLPSSAI
jgi:hypothetical protein